MPYPRSGLDYYALSGSAPIAKLATFVREQGGLRRTVQTLGSLGAVDHDTAWANLLAGWQLINDNPLPDDVDPNSDFAQSRALVIAALVAAQNKLQGDATAGTSDPAYQRVASAFQSHVAAARSAEMPSAFMLSLSNASDRISGGLGAWGSILGDPKKLLLYAGIGVALYLSLPMLLARRRTA